MILDSNDVREVVVDVTRTLGLPSHPDTRPAALHGGAEVLFHGGFEGVVQVRCEPDVARYVASSLGLGDTDEDAEGALSELANMMAGNLKVLLPTDGAPAMLSPPVPTQDHAGPLLAECSVRCEAGHITVRVIETPAGSAK